MKKYLGTILGAIVICGFLAGMALAADYYIKSYTWSSARLTANRTGETVRIGAATQFAVQNVLSDANTADTIAGTLNLQVSVDCSTWETYDSQAITSITQTKFWNVYLASYPCWRQTYTYTSGGTSTDITTVYSYKKQ